MIERLRRAQNSLKVRLFAATILLLALALGLSALAFERSARGVVLDAVRSHLAARARESLEAVARFQSERAMTARSWAEAEAMQTSLDTGDPKFAEDFLRRAIQDQGGSFSAAALLDPHGKTITWVRAGTEGERRGEALTSLRGRVVDLPPVGPALAGNAFRVELASIARFDPLQPDVPAPIVASPVKDFAGDIVGVVVAAVSPVAISRLVARITGTAGGYEPAVFDVNRRLILASPSARHAEVLAAAPAPVSQPGALERHLGADDEPLLAVRTAPLAEEPRWAAVMLLPEQEAYGPVRRLRHLLGGLFAAVLLGATLASVIALGRAARPLSEVSASMVKVSSGDLTTRLPDIYSDELGHLVRSFNTMVSEVARSRDELKATEALRREMQIAQQIQTAILPGNPALRGFEVAARMKPADDVGGDLYDILPFDDTFWVLIGDVSGHGINSGLVMMMAQAAAYAAIGENPSCTPREVLGTVNRVLHENVRKRMGRDDYLTLMISRHVGDGRFLAAGAHQPIFIGRSSGGVDVVEPSGPWCGLEADLAKRATEYEFNLGPGDMMCLITDGIVEATSREAGMYGQDRLVDVFSRRSPSASTALAEVFSSVEQFLTHQDDDMTAVVLKRTIHANS